MACSISLKHTFLTTICLCYDNYGPDISEGQVKYLHVYQGVKINNSLHVYKTIDIVHIVHYKFQRLSVVANSVYNIYKTFSVFRSYLSYLLSASD